MENSRIIFQEVNKLANKIADDIWPKIEQEEANKYIKYDISEYDLSYKGKITMLKINKKAKEQKDNDSKPPTAQVRLNFPNKCTILCGSKGGLLHELYHFIFAIKNETEGNEHILIEYIKSKCRPRHVKLATYLSLCKNDTEKAIGYLYIASNDEIGAKVTGHSLSNWESASSKRNLKFYNNIKNFNFTDKSLQHNDSKEVEVLKKYLEKIKITPKSTNIEEYFQVQYKLLVELKDSIVK